MDTNDEEEWKTGNKLKKKIKEMRMTLPTLAAAFDRHDVSNRTAAFIATVVLQDKRKLSQENKSKGIDRNKVRRGRHKKYKELTSDRIPMCFCWTIF